MKWLTRFLMWLDIKRLQIKSGGYTYKEMQLDLARVLAENNELRAQLRLTKGALTLDAQIERMKTLLALAESRDEADDEYF